MNLKLFIEDTKGYVDTYKNVWAVNIKKIEGKNTLEIKYNSLKENDYINLSEVRLAYLINIDSMHEYFRYVK